MREGGSGDEMIPKKILEKMTTEKGRHFWGKNRVTPWVAAPSDNKLSGATAYTTTAAMGNALELNNIDV